MYVELQPVTTIMIANNGHFVHQPRAEWMDVTNYTGGVFVVEILGITSCIFRLVTSVGEDAVYRSIVTTSTTGTTFYNANPNDITQELLARNVFWRIHATADNAEATFRVRAVLKNL